MIGVGSDGDSSCHHYLIVSLQKKIIIMAEIRVRINKGPWTETYIDRINEAAQEKMSVISDREEYILLQFPYVGSISPDVLGVIADNADEIIVC